MSLTKIAKMVSLSWTKWPPEQIEKKIFKHMFFIFIIFFCCCFFFFVFFVSSSKHEVLKVSYCDRSISVMRRARSVVRRQYFALKAYFYSIWPVDSNLGRKHRNDRSIRSIIDKIVAIGNPRWPPRPPSWQSIFRFFSWTLSPITIQLGRQHRGDL